MLVARIEFTLIDIRSDKASPVAWGNTHIYHHGNKTTSIDSQYC